MICVLCASIIFAVCHLSYSLENQQTSFYVNQKHAPQYPQSSLTKRAVARPQPNAKDQSDIVDSNPDTQRRNRHYSSYSSDGPKYKEKLWRFELDVPEVLDTLKKYTGLSIIDAKDSGHLRTKEDSLLGQRLRFEVKPPNIAAIMGYVSEFISVQSARRIFNKVLNGYLEEGPGTVKSAPVDYPPGFEAGRLQRLLYIKKKREG